MKHMAIYWDRDTSESTREYARQLLRSYNHYQYIEKKLVPGLRLEYREED